MERKMKNISKNMKIVALVFGALLVIDFVLLGLSSFSTDLNQVEKLTGKLIVGNLIVLAVLGVYFLVKSKIKPVRT